jgi:hypothetical protein
MAIAAATFTFSLPEDTESDILRLLQATTKDGTYSLVASITYSYGTITHEYDSTDTLKWYKVQFYNSVDAEAGPLSEAVYGGNFDNAAPFLAVSTTTDGAQYATAQDVYDYATLTTNDATLSNINKALKKARALVDLRTADLGVDRFLRDFTTEVSRKKYNATLQIVREAEICLALGHIYRGLSDDMIMDEIRNPNSGKSTVSIGDTSLSEPTGLNQENVAYLAALATRYFNTGENLLASIQPVSLDIRTGETRPGRSFFFPD